MPVRSLISHTHTEKPTFIRRVEALFIEGTLVA